MKRKHKPKPQPKRHLNTPKPNSNKRKGERCSFGGFHKLRTHKNYPFGRKSKPVTYKICVKCKKRIKKKEK